MYLFFVDDVTGNEQFEDTKESGLESDEAGDSDEDRPDSLHPVGQDGPSHRQAEHQQVDDLELELVWTMYDEIQRYPDGVGLDLVHRPLVDDHHLLAWL